MFPDEDRSQVFVSGAGMQVEMHKVKVLEDWPVVGFVSYYPHQGFVM